MTSSNISATTRFGSYWVQPNSESTQVDEKRILDELCRSLKNNDENALSLLLESIPIENRAKYLSTTLQDGFNAFHFAVINRKKNLLIKMIDSLSLSDKKACLESKTQDNFEGSLLHIAVCFEDLEIVEYLLDQEVEVNAQNAEKFTALMIAVDKGNLKIVEALLNKGADVNAKDKNGRSSIIIAAATPETDDNIEILKAILKADSSQINCKDINDFSALQYAVVMSHPKKVELLLEMDADKNADCGGFTPLMQASKMGNLKLVNILLDYNADVNFQNSDEFTALLEAIGNNHYEIVLALLNKKADVFKTYKNISMFNLTYLMPKTEITLNILDALLTKSQLGDNKKNILSLVFTSINLERNQALEILLKRHPEIVNDTHGDTTPLMKASMRGNLQAVKALLLSGANIDFQNSKGISALMVAVDNSHYEIVIELLKNEADINAKNDQGLTSQMISASMPDTDDNFKIFKALLEKDNSQIDSKDVDGYSALLFAVFNNSFQKVNFLLNQKADIEITDHTGINPLMVASKFGNLEMLKALLKFNAEINFHDDNGYSALTYAVEKGHYEIVIELLKNKAAVSMRDAYDLSIISNAALSGNSETNEKILEALIKIDPSQVNLKDKNGRTPLFYANNRKKVEILLKNNAETNLIDHQKKNPLMCVSALGHLDTVKTFLQLGYYNINDKDINDCTALILAAAKGHYDVVIELLKNGADVNANDKTGVSVLMVAVAEGHFKIALALLKWGANSNAIDYLNTTALMLAKTAKEVILLVEFFKSFVDKQNYLGQTALIEAIRTRNKPKALALIYNRANPDIQDIRGVSALIQASSDPSQDNMVDRLLKANANPNITDIAGFSALDYAQILKLDKTAVLLEKKGAITNNSKLNFCIQSILNGIHNGSTISLNIRKKRNALVIFPKYEKRYEKSTAFSIIWKIQTLALILKKYNVDSSFVSSIDDLNRLLKLRSYDLLYIAGHGSSDAIDLSDDFMLQKSQIKELDFSTLKTTSNIIVDGCSTGKENGIAEKIAKKSKRVVIAPTKKANGYLDKINLLKKGMIDVGFYKTKKNLVDITRVINPEDLKKNKVSQ